MAIGFRMNLFNIGVDGQYRLAAMLAGAFGGAVALPTGLRQVAIILVAMLVGAAWAGLVALLKVTRGVSEVISSIMLNFVATGMIAYLMRPSILGVRSSDANDVTTKPIPKSGQVGGLDLISGAGGKVYGLIVLAVVVGVVFQVLIGNTRFGFDLRATGRSTAAAQASGVNVKRMIVTTMLLSGATAGLVGMPALLGESHSYSSITFQTGLGFTGIAIALLGRNTPLGIAVRIAALGVPRPIGADPGPQRHPEGDRADHPRGGGAVRRRCLRVGAPHRSHPSATGGGTRAGRPGRHAGPRGGRSSAVTVSEHASLVPAATPALRTRRTSGARIGLAFLVAFVLLALVRVVTGANDLSSGGALGATIGLAMPIGLAGLGGLWSERSGVVNIGLEGMMILGTFFGAAFAYFSHSPWMGVLGGIVGGLLGGLVHAVATVTFGVDQIISGVAITILATGLARYLAGVFFTGQPGGGPTQSPTIPQFTKLAVPGANTALGKIERHHWFLLSDLCGLLRGLATTLTPFTIVMLLLFPLTWFALWRTPVGLHLRFCGENPAAAESLGVPVYRMKYLAVLVSGMLAGLAGAFLADFAGIYREGQTGGRGYIGLAAMIFGNWRPGGLAAGAGLFGYTDAVQSRQGAKSVHALLLLAVFLLAAIAVYQLYRRRVRSAAGTALAAALILVWFLTTDDVPIELVPYTPYIITLLVLALASQRLRMPAADGLPWRKGQGA